jgi:hypothetical protein
VTNEDGVLRAQERLRRLAEGASALADQPDFIRRLQDAAEADDPSTVLEGGLGWPGMNVPVESCIPIFRQVFADWLVPARICRITRPPYSVICVEYLPPFDPEITYGPTPMPPPPWDQNPGLYVGVLEAAGLVKCIEGQWLAKLEIQLMPEWVCGTYVNPWF